MNNTKRSWDSRKIILSLRSETKLLSAPTVSSNTSLCAIPINVEGKCLPLKRTQDFATSSHTLNKFGVLNQRKNSADEFLQKILYPMKENNVMEMNDFLGQFGIEGQIQCSN